MNKIIAVTALVAAMTSSDIFAADANVNFTGSVTNGTCVMNPSDSTKALIFPDMPAVKAGGATGQRVSGKISFTGCPTTFSGVTTWISSISGIPLGDANGGGVVPSGTAKNLAIFLTTNDTLLKIDGSNSKTAQISLLGEANVPILLALAKAKDFVSSYGEPTPGDYNTTFTLSFSYA